MRIVLRALLLLLSAAVPVTLPALARADAVPECSQGEIPECHPGDHHGCTGRCIDDPHAEDSGCHVAQVGARTDTPFILLAVLLGLAMVAQRRTAGGRAARRRG